MTVSSLVLLLTWLLFTVATESTFVYSITQPNRKIQLITFDLDDTLFPVAQVIEDSNQRLIQSLQSLGYMDTTLEGFVDATRRVRFHLETTHSSGTAFRYTDIRKLAIQQEMMNHTIPTAMTILPQYQHHVSSVYAHWEEERHASAERHLYPDTLSMLQQIQHSFPNAIVGAITNGKGNPLAMTRTLAPYFDFCVSGEDETVFPHRKPHATIFQVALDCAHEILLSQQTDRTEKVEEEALASGWIHVGDDLCNDVAASAACGAKAIWVDLKPEYGQTSSKRLQGLNPSWSTASSAEIDQRRIASQEAQRSSVTARVERLSDLPGVLAKL